MVESVRMRKKIGIALGIVLLGALGVAGLSHWGYFRTRPVYPMELSLGDTVVSWQFKGAYAESPDLERKAQDEIKRLNSLFGTGGYSDYTLYVSIANQYDLLGDGKNEWSYLKSALAVDATSTGLAWYNAGQLFDRLGAVETARLCLQKAVEAQPIPQYGYALQDLLTRRFPNDPGLKK